MLHPQNAAQRKPVRTNVLCHYHSGEHRDLYLGERPPTVPFSMKFATRKGSADRTQGSQKHEVPHTTEQ
jgi:hypothetical protein